MRAQAAGQATAGGRPAAWNDTAQSLWEATAHARPPAIQAEGAMHADVVIIGAGYLGLNTALTLAETGANVIVLDAQGPGYGASGRNGGQVIPGLKYDPDALVSMYGARVADELIDFVGSAADRVFDTIRRHGIECDAAQNGWIQGAHNASALTLLRARAAQWHARGARVEVLDQDAVTDAVGCAPGVYLGGWRDTRAGVIQPLNYALGLADAAARRGVRIYSNTVARHIERRDAHWCVESTNGAVISAEQVVVATNAYTDDLWKTLRLSVIPAQSFQVATDPLSKAHLTQILKQRTAVSDARRLLHYYRLDAAGRFVMGGRGTLSPASGPDDFKHIQRAVAKTFPSLKDVPIVHRWAGRLAMTRDGLPHLHQPAPGITIALGCNGRGIALTTAIGQRIASHLATGQALPFQTQPIKPIPLHGLHRSYVTALVQYYKIRDMI
jgi:glycine/D-amino acid oxidase-like deaminating enzyme